MKRLRRTGGESLDRTTVDPAKTGSAASQPLRREGCDADGPQAGRELRCDPEDLRARQLTEHYHSLNSGQERVATTVCVLGSRVCHPAA